MKKLVSLLLVLMLVIALVPMSASAIAVEVIGGKQYVQWDEGGNWAVYNDGKFEGFVSTLPGQEVAPPAYEHPHAEDPNDHTYGWGSNTKYHWLACACGHKISMERHVDPLDTEDDYCYCGYHFSDNADLVTLWVSDCTPIKDFDWDTTEYTLHAYTYKEVNEIKRIATRTFDSEATVELPEDLTLKQGENTIEVKVTAENKKVTKTYTLTIIKE